MSGYLPHGHQRSCCRLNYVEYCNTLRLNVGIFCLSATYGFELVNVRDLQCLSGDGTTAGEILEDSVITW
jgi:hypothetical protein